MPWVEWAASMGWTTWTWTTPTSTLSTTSTLGRSSDWQMTFCPSHSPEIFEEQNIQNTKARSNKKGLREIESYVDEKREKGKLKKKC